MLQVVHLLTCLYIGMLFMGVVYNLHMLQVLQCVSRLELAQLIGTGVKTRYLTHGGLQQTPKAARTSANIDSVLSGSGECCCLAE